MRTRALLASLMAVSAFLSIASSSWARSQCPDHYATVESSGDLNAFLDSFDWKFGTSDAEEVWINGQRTPLDRSKITGAYGCQFNGKFPPESACPSGTTLTRGTDVRYICHANEPIADESKTCVDGFSKIQDYEYAKAPGKIGRFGFICNAASDDGQDGFNEGVCMGSGAATLLNFVHYEQGSLFPMLGCITLK